MKSTSDSQRRQLVLVGGGHSHVEVIRRLAKKPVPDLAVTLVAREAATAYTGMLPGYIAGRYSHDECHIDLYRLCGAANARLYTDEATGIDVATQRIYCRSRPAVPYDLLSIDIGSMPDQTRVPGAIEHTLPVKPVDRFIAGLRDIETRLLAAQTEFRVAVVGGGAGGTELCLALHYRFHSAIAAAGGNLARVTLCLVSESGTLLPTHNRGVQSSLMRAVRSRGIELHLGCRVSSVSAGQLHLANTRSIGFDAAFWATNAKPADWLRSTELALDERGFIRVDSFLRSRSHPNVFAAGDVAAFDEYPLEKSGVYAVRQGPVLSHNLSAHVRGEALKSYWPQRRTLALVSTGDRYAVASKWRLSARGRWVWSLKDRIDRRWMRRYQQLATMSRSGPEAAAGGSTPPILCGGCGAKAGSSMLNRVLGELEKRSRPDVLIDLQQPDDAAVFVVPEGMTLVQSVDYFRPFINDPYRFARIATNHCLSDLYAMGAWPHSALAIVTLAHGAEQAAEADLRQLLRGCKDALDLAGATLIGGHTGRGEELGFGLSVNGLARRDQLLRKGALRPGQSLILTKPLGTGVLFAGLMRGASKASWIEAALDTMDQSSLAALDVLRRFEVSACTDITGFGLVGHLLEMLVASGTDATLHPSSIPALAGAAELLAQGVESSLAPENRKFGKSVRNLSTAAPAAVDLLFDPQTAGGLVVGVEADRAERCVAALNAGGFASARVIGSVTVRSSDRVAITLLN